MTAAQREAREFWFGLARDISALASMCIFVFAVVYIAAGIAG